MPGSSLQPLHRQRLWTRRRPARRGAASERESECASGKRGNAHSLFHCRVVGTSKASLACDGLEPRQCLLRKMESKRPRLKGQLRRWSRTQSPRRSIVEITPCLRDHAQLRHARLRPWVTSGDERTSSTRASFLAFPTSRYTLARLHRLESGTSRVCKRKPLPLRVVRSSQRLARLGPAPDMPTTAHGPPRNPDPGQHADLTHAGGTGFDESRLDRAQPLHMHDLGRLAGAANHSANPRPASHPFWTPHPADDAALGMSPSTLRWMKNSGTPASLRFAPGWGSWRTATLTQNGTGDGAASGSETQTGKRSPLLGRARGSRSSTSVVRRATFIGCHYPSFRHGKLSRPRGPVHLAHPRHGFFYDAETGTDEQSGAPIRERTSREFPQLSHEGSLPASSPEKTLTAYWDPPYAQDAALQPSKETLDWMRSGERAASATVAAHSSFGGAGTGREAMGDCEGGYLLALQRQSELGLSTDGIC